MFIDDGDDDDELSAAAPPPQQEERLEQPILLPQQPPPTHCPSPQSVPPQLISVVGFAGPLPATTWHSAAAAAPAPPPAAPGPRARGRLAEVNQVEPVVASLVPATAPAAPAAPAKPGRVKQFAAKKTGGVAASAARDARQIDQASREVAALTAERDAAVRERDALGGARTASPAPVARAALAKKARANQQAASGKAGKAGKAKSTTAAPAARAAKPAAPAAPTAAAQIEPLASSQAGPAVVSTAATAAAPPRGGGHAAHAPQQPQAQAQAPAESLRDLPKGRHVEVYYAFPPKWHPGKVVRYQATPHGLVCWVGYLKVRRSRRLCHRTVIIAAASPCRRCHGRCGRRPCEVAPPSLPCLLFMKPTVAKSQARGQQQEVELDGLGGALAMCRPGTHLEPNAFGKKGHNWPTPEDRPTSAAVI